jgi:predicted TIM-barrel fold metal-dependent hydrolase
MDNDVIQQMDYWVGERGMSGPRLFTTGSTMGQAAWPDDPETKPAWADMTEQRIPVCDRIAWGSHYPANEGTLGSLVSLLEEAAVGLGSAHVDNIYSGTALRLYPKLA